MTKANLPAIVKTRKVDFTTQKGRTNYRYKDLASIMNHDRAGFIRQWAFRPLPPRGGAEPADFRHLHHFAPHGP
ncbi:hypothetical protein RvVAR0630_18680 [Agrobacterium vitis]|nr:hypothetical protein RvVAR0630_18680 [Agrobacterium vitis]